MLWAGGRSSFRLQQLSFCSTHLPCLVLVKVTIHGPTQFHMLIFNVSSFLTFLFIYSASKQAHNDIPIIKWSIHAMKHYMYWICESQLFECKKSRVFCVKLLFIMVLNRKLYTIKTSVSQQNTSTLNNDAGWCFKVYNLRSFLFYLRYPMGTRVIYMYYLVTSSLTVSRFRRWKARKPSHDVSRRLLHASG